MPMLPKALPFLRMRLDFSLYIVQNESNVNSKRSLEEVMSLEDRLRETEFAFIEFRHSPVGRQAYMKGSRLPVWWVIHVAQASGRDAKKIAEHFRRPLAWAKAALHYYVAHPEEIDRPLPTIRIPTSRR